MKLLLRAAAYHWETHWSNPANFWSGVLGMIVNNVLTLLGIWAMLFAGKEALNDERDFFFLMNFIVMISYGFVHVFLGGISDLDKQINGGGLDLALTSPRSPFVLLSLTSSHLPAFGDLLMGILGVMMLGIRGGWLMLANGVVMAFCAIVVMYSFLLIVGSMAFWFRRTEAIYSVMINMFLAFNTYPVVNTAGGVRWVLFLLPVLMAGMIPAYYVLNPSWEVLAAEVGGSLLFAAFAKGVFYWGMRRYQSAAGLGLVR